MTLLVHYFAVGGRGIGPTYPTRRMSAGSAAPTRQTSLAVDNSRSQTIFGSFAPSQSLRRLVRQGEVAHPPGLGTNRRTCHPHADNTRRHPRLAPAGRVRTRAQHQGRGREAPALAPRRAVGCVSGGVAGRVGWRRRSGGTCRPASVALLRAAAYSRRRGRGWGRWGPLRLCVVGAACSLVITAGCISGGCGAWWLAAALLMTRRSAPSVRPFRAGHLQPPSRPLMGPPGSSHLRFVGVSCSLGRRLVVSQQHHGRSGVSPGPLLSAPPHPAREGGAWRLGEAPPAKPAAGGPEPPDFPTLQKNGPDSDSTHTQNERRVAQIYPRVCPHAIHEPRSPLSRLEQPISSFYCRP